MKQNVFVKTLLVLSSLATGGAAFGSHVVCSAPELFYSSVRGDFGTPPPPGTVIGKVTIYSKGVVTETSTLAGTPNPTVVKYGVDFQGTQQELARTGSPVSGSRVYRQTAVLKTLPPFEAKELLRTPVVCEQTWAMVP